MTRGRSTRLRLATLRGVVAWGAIGVYLVGLTVTPGVRHGDVADEEAQDAVVEPAPGDREERDVVVYRRPGRSRSSSRSTRAGHPSPTLVAHHEGAAGHEPFVHTHDGRNPHAHYVILGVEVTLPVSGSGETSETLLAEDETKSKSESESKLVSDGRPAVVPATVGNGSEPPSATTGYLRPERTTPPDPLPGESASVALLRPASPYLDGDDPVPRPPRV